MTHADGRTWRLFAATLLLTLAACGGEIGLDASPPTAPTPAQKAQRPLVLTSTNASAAAEAAILAGSATLGIGQMATAWLEAVDASGGGTAQADCVSGSGALTLTDRDGNHRPSAGDRITAQLSQCHLRELDKDFSGSMTIDLVASNDITVRWSGTLTPGSDFAGAQGGITIQLSGTLQFDHRSSAVSKSVHVVTQGSGLRFTSTDGTRSLTETLSDMVALREVRRDTARATSQFSFRLASEALEGAVTVSTPTTFSAWFGTYPDLGELLVTGVNTSVRILAAAQGTAQIELRLGGTSIGGFELTDAGTGLLWSGLGWVPPDPALPGYGTTPAALGRFAQIGAISTNTSSTHPSYAWAYSKPLVGAISGSFVRLSPGSGQPWEASEIAAQVTVQGAFLEIQPASQLEPGASYRLDLRGNGDSADFHDADGSSLAVPTRTLAVDDSIRAIASVPAPALLAGQGARITLDASASNANGDAVASTRWTQLSGPAVAFDSTSAPVVQVSAASSESGIATVQVEVANGSGDTDHQTLQFRVLPDVTDVLLLHLRQAGVTSLMLTSVDVPGSTATVTNFQAKGLDILLQISGDHFYRLLSGAAGLGSYIYPARFQGAWTTDDAPWSCSDGHGYGTIVVSEFVRDPRGNMLRLALDFDNSCPSRPTLFASVRFNSALPLKP
jgi:hypothetical protein